MTAHRCIDRARETIKLLTNSTPDFIPPTLRQPNSPDLNPVDDKIWSVMQELKTMSCASASKACWLEQRIVAVMQWRTRLHACVKAKGDHFERKLP